jgi:hypothetical protein
MPDSPQLFSANMSIDTTPVIGLRTNTLVFSLDSTLNPIAKSEFFVTASVRELPVPL